MSDQIFNKLYKISQCVQFFKTIRKSPELYPCALQQHNQFIDWMIYLLTFHIVVAVVSITDKSKYTFENWLEEAKNIDSLDSQIWKNASEKYEELQSSDTHKAIHDVRTKLYAHSVVNDATGFSDSTYGELFKYVKSLQEIYDSVAKQLPQCSTRFWDFEDCSVRAMGDLEKGSHDPKIHQDALAYARSKGLASHTSYSKS